MGNNNSTQPSPTSPIPAPMPTPMDNLPKTSPPPRHLPKKLAILILIIIGFIFITGFAGAYFMGKNSNNPSALAPSPTPDEQAVACTMEVKLCPDGVTSVGRQGPKCEFAPCPTGAASSSDNSSMKSYSSVCGFSINYPSDGKVQKYFITDSLNSCAYITGPDYSSGTDSRTGLYIQVTRTKLGTKGNNVTINNLEDYFAENEAIISPAVNPEPKVNKTYGPYSGIAYTRVGYEPGKSFIFIKDGYVYEVNWDDDSEAEKMTEIENIIKSIKFN